MSELEPKGKRIAIFLDGTWNNLFDNTNVWRLKSLCKQNNEQIIYYSKGVGTQIGTKLLGGAVGYGIDQGVIDAYEWLIENYNPDDKLYIFGFSRGAYTARSLSGLISKCGLLDRGAPLSVRELYNRYRNQDIKGKKTVAKRTIRQLIVDINAMKDAANLDQQEKWMLKYCQKPDIYFLGVWDTVGALGIKLPFGDIPYIGSGYYKFLETDIRITNKNVYHALAIDEHRKKFAPTLITKPKGNLAEPRKIENVEQRWFVGAHANVGGGYQSDLLAQRPLQWIMCKASIHGLEFHKEPKDIIDDETTYPDINDSYAAFLGGLLKFLPFSKRYYRQIGGPESQEEGTSINETIDYTVFQRWNKKADYRPKNLLDWANKHSITIESLSNKTVRADNPRVTYDD